MVAKVVMKAVKMWNRRFCWNKFSMARIAAIHKGLLFTYDRNTEGHGIEGNGGDEHNDEDNPDVYHQHGCLELGRGGSYQRVRLPTSPASW